MTEPSLHGQSCTSTVVATSTIGTLGAALKTSLVTKGAHWAAHSSDAANFTVPARWADVARRAISGCGVVGPTCTVVTWGTLGHRCCIS